MSSQAFKFENKVDPALEGAVEARLSAYNRVNAARWDQNHDVTFMAEPLHIFVFDLEDHLIGGITGRTHALREWLEILVLWVDEAYRRTGIGRELISRAEDEARNRGYRYARLASSDYQAPVFYRKVGYIEFGKLANCPSGDTAYYFWKRIGS